MTIVQTIDRSFDNPLNQPLNTKIDVIALVRPGLDETTAFK